MGNLLYKLGNWSYNKRRKVLTSWIVIIIALGILLANLGINFDENMSIPGTKSEKAMNLVNKEFPSSEKEDAGKVKMVFKAPKNKEMTTQTTQNKIEKSLSDISKDKYVKSVTSPYEGGTISKDKKVAYADITYKNKKENVKDSSKDKIKQVKKHLEASNITTELGGNVEFTSTDIGGASEVIGIVIAFLILAFTFASFISAGIPIITAIIGLIIGMLSIAIGTNFAPIQSVSLTLAVMISLAVGIDYALFILSRYRQHLGEGMNVQESISRAIATAGSAVVFAGLTVVVALCGLSIVGIPFLTAMGLTAALSVFIVILIAITLLPAIIGMFGYKIKPSKKNRLLSWSHSKKSKKNSNLWGRIVTKLPTLTIIITIVLAVLLSLSALKMDLGIPDDSMKSKDTDNRKAYDLMSEGFGEGVNGPLVVVMKSSSEKKANKFFSETKNNIENLPNIENMSEIIPNKKGNVAMVNIQPKTGPNDTKTKKLVHSIQKKAKNINDNELMVTGSTAVNIDISDKLSEAVPKFVSIIAIFALILLTFVFRSILVPLKAVLGFLMTLTATIGFAVLVLQEGHLNNIFSIAEKGPLLNFMPILITGILFGLAMDYEVFLVSRMRERYIETKNAKDAVLYGMKHSGPIVTAAALIMIAVFASFIFVEDITIKSMGLTLAFGVLFDAFIVRMTFVPAVMFILGKWSWYLPKWLDNILPSIDIEGNNIEKDGDYSPPNFNSSYELYNKETNQIKTIKINKKTLNLYNELNNVLYDEHLMFKALLKYSKEIDYGIYQKFTSDFKSTVETQGTTTEKNNANNKELMDLLNKQSENINMVNRILLKVIEKD